MFFSTQSRRQSQLLLVVFLSRNKKRSWAGPLTSGAKAPQTARHHRTFLSVELVSFRNHCTDAIQRQLGCLCSDATKEHRALWEIWFYRWHPILHYRLRRDPTPTQIYKSHRYSWHIWQLLHELKKMLLHVLNYANGSANAHTACVDVLVFDVYIRIFLTVYFSKSQHQSAWALFIKASFAHFFKVISTFCMNGMAHSRPQSKPTHLQMNVYCIVVFCLMFISQSLTLWNQIFFLIYLNKWNGFPDLLWVLWQ